MKKINYIVVASLVAAIAAVSCNKEEMQLSSVSEGTVLTADIAGTKTSMSDANEGAANVSIVWTEGDKLSVLSGESYATNNEFTLSAGAGEASASFTGAGISGNIIAVYPYASTVAYSADTITLNIPKTQAYASASFAQNSVPMVAKGTVGSNLTFNYLFSAIAFKVNGSGKNVTKVTVAATTPLWGPAEITGLDSTPVIKLTGTDYKYFTVELTCDSEDISSDKMFYVAVPAGTYTFAVNVYCGSEVFHTNYTTAKTFTVGGIKYNSTAKEFTDNGPAYVEGNYIGDAIKAGNYWWAPVNCGYDAVNYTYGKLYQWGRKYGQGYNKDTVVDGDYPGKSTTQKFVALSSALTSHPDGDTYNGSFYTGQGNWYGGTLPNALWRATKTDFDPCPAGWRVPTNTEVVALMGSATGKRTIANGPHGASTCKGLYFDGTTTGNPTSGVFLPAAGGRSFNGGGASGRTTYGGYWSSSVAGYSSSDAAYVEKACLLYYNANNAYKINYKRGNAYAVRCVKE